MFYFDYAAHYKNVHTYDLKRFLKLLLHGKLRPVIHEIFFSSTFEFKYNMQLSEILETCRAGSLILNRVSSQCFTRFCNFYPLRSILTLQLCTLRQLFQRSQYLVQILQFVEEGFFHTKGIKNYLSLKLLEGLLLYALYLVYPFPCSSYRYRISEKKDRSYLLAMRQVQTVLT